MSQELSLLCGTVPWVTIHAPSPEPEPVEVGTSIELFTGGGGLAWAMHEAGFRHLMAAEWDKRACETLRLNSAKDHVEGDPDPTSLGDKWPLKEQDVHGVDFKPWEGKVDVIAGGVPCQPWSLGGVHKGYDDPRNLWPELFRCIRETRPRAIIAENVKGLLRPSFKPYYEYIIRELSAPFIERVEGEDWRDHDKRLIKALENAGDDPAERYDVQYKLVNAADYGVPQVRWRVFVIAFRKDLGLADWQFPEPTHSDLALLHSQQSGEYWKRHGISPPETMGQEALPLPPPDGKLPWRTLRDAIRPGEKGLRKLRLPEPLEPLEAKLEHPKWRHHFGWPGARIYPGHTPNELDRPAKTVKAGVHGVPGGETVLRRDDGSIRYMTVREVARVMTFPDHWKIAGPRGEQMRQLGNAVPVVLGRVVADSVARALRPSLGVADPSSPIE